MGVLSLGAQRFPEGALVSVCLGEPFEDERSDDGFRRLFDCLSKQRSPLLGAKRQIYECSGSQ